MRVSRSDTLRVCDGSINYKFIWNGLTGVRRADRKEESWNDIENIRSDDDKVANVKSDRKSVFFYCPHHNMIFRSSREQSRKNDAAGINRKPFTYTIIWLWKGKIKSRVKVKEKIAKNEKLIIFIAVRAVSIDWINIEQHHNITSSISTSIKTKSIAIVMK